jgi:hypothetical protein
MMGIERAIVPEMLPGREVRSEGCRICTAESAYPNVHIAAFPQEEDFITKDN